MSTGLPEGWLSHLAQLALRAPHTGRGRENDERVALNRPQATSENLTLAFGRFDLAMVVVGGQFRLSVSIHAVRIELASMERVSRLANSALCSTLPILSTPRWFFFYDDACEAFGKNGPSDMYSRSGNICTLAGGHFSDVSEE